LLYGASKGLLSHGFNFMVVGVTAQQSLGHTVYAV